MATDPGVLRADRGIRHAARDPVDDDAGEGDILRPVVYSLDALLLFVGLVNLLATLLLTTRERVRDLGLLKAVGLTPDQVTGSLVSEQALVAAVAALAGIPLGLGLFRLGIGLSGGSDEFAYPVLVVAGAPRPRRRVAGRGALCSGRPTREPDPGCRRPALRVIPGARAPSAPALRYVAARYPQELEPETQ